MNQPFAHTIQEAVVLSRASRTALYQALQKGELRAVKRGTRTLILASDLKAWLESLPAYRPSNALR